MAHLPAKESDVEKVIRIAKELDISIEDAAVTCDAFELAFSDEGLRRAIFEMIDELDHEAAKKGEPFGLILTYAVELGLDGIRVGRYADEIPAGEVVTLTPTDRARILLRIKENFPTQQYLGPVIVDRPVYEFENEELPEFLRASQPTAVLSNESKIQNPKSQIEHTELSSLARRSTGQYCWPERGWQTDDVFCRADGVVCSDSEISESELPTELPSNWPDIAICLGPIRLTFDERFPSVSANASKSQRTGAMSIMSSAGRTALKPARQLPPLAALQAGGPAFQLTSGLSPPL
jgi:hypothetical protein